MLLTTALSCLLWATAQIAFQGGSQLLPQLSQPRDLASLLGCSVGLRGGLEQCWAPYQQLIPSWPAPGLPFSETAALILTHGVFTSDSTLIVYRQSSDNPSLALQPSSSTRIKTKHLQVLQEWAWFPSALVTRSRCHKMKVLEVETPEINHQLPPLTLS